MTDLASTPPAEKIGRGVFFALIALPVGIAAWLLIWSFGFIASIVAFGVALLAAFLYRLGSGGRIGKYGALAVSLITVGTIAIAFYAGLVLDVATAIADQTGLTWWDVVTHPLFGDAFAEMTAENSEGITGDLIWTILFTALGAGSVLLSVFRDAKASRTTAAAAAAQPEAQPEPQADPAPETDSAK